MSVQVVETAEALADALADASHEQIVAEPGDYLAPPGGFQIKRGVRLGGRMLMKDRLLPGSVRIIPASPDDDCLVITAPNVWIEQLAIHGKGRPGRGCCIHAGLDIHGGCLTLADVMVWGTGSTGIEVARY